MINRISKCEYEISNEGLGGKFYFSPGNYCGLINSGIALRITLQGSWVISVSDAWKMTLISTFKLFQRELYLLSQAMKQGWSIK